MMQQITAKLASTRFQRGYTLGELLVTMGIVGILSAVAVPGMSDMVQNNRRTTTTNDMVLTMQMARSEAVTRNQQVRVCASRNGAVCTSKDYWSEGWIMFNDIDGNGAPGGAGEEILRYTKTKPGISVQPFDFLNHFVYRPNGRFEAREGDVNSGQMVVCDSRGADKARMIIVDASGRPRVSDKTKAGANLRC